jgi:hypothetical protein
MIFLPNHDAELSEAELIQKIWLGRCGGIRAGWRELGQKSFVCGGKMKITKNILLFFCLP